MRYFDTEIWDSEKEVADYLHQLFASADVKAYGGQIWAQPVFTPEIECILEFTDAELLAIWRDKIPVHQGKLLVWGPVACYRDGRGKWSFLSCYTLYKASHPSRPNAPGDTQRIVK